MEIFAYVWFEIPSLFTQVNNKNITALKPCLYILRCCDGNYTGVTKTFTADSPNTRLVKVPITPRNDYP